MPVIPSPDARPTGADLRLRWLSGVILAIVACMAVLPWISSRAADTTMAQLTAVATEERAYNRLLDMLTDAETGQRGYIITGDRAFLAPYASGVAAIPAALRDLDAMADIPQERATVNAIRELTDKKLDLLAAAIRIRARDGFEPAAHIVAGGEGKVYMDRLRVLIGERQTVLAGQRDTLRQRMHATLDYNSILGLAASLASAFVICVALYLAGRGLRERGAAAEQARQLGAAQAAQARRGAEQNQRLAVSAQMLQAMDSLTDANELAGVLQRINDTHGHDAGDAVLRTVGRCLYDGVRRSDIACRYGGEALALVLPECDATAAARCADTVRGAIGALMLTHRDLALPQVTASCGVAAWPEHGADAEALLQAADGALYAARNAGRDRVCVA